MGRHKTSAYIGVRGKQCLRGYLGTGQWRCARINNNRARPCVINTDGTKKGQFVRREREHILKTAIETPLVFIIYSNLRAIRPLPV